MLVNTDFISNLSARVNSESLDWLMWNKRWNCKRHIQGLKRIIKWDFYELIIMTNKGSSEPKEEHSRESN